MTRRPSLLRLASWAALCTVAVLACQPADDARRDAEDRPLVPGMPTERFTLGGLGDEDLSLGDRLFLAFDEEGRLHVLDASNNRTLLVDLAGRIVWTYEREGRGPGELMYPVGLGVSPEGSQVVADLGNQRLTVIGPDGAFVGSVPVEAEEGFPVGTLAVVGGEVFSAPDPEVYGVTAPADSVRFQIRAHALDTVRVRAVASAWRAPEPPPTETLTLGGNTMRIRAAGMTDLKGYWPWVRLAGIGPLIAVSDSTTYAVDVMDTEGRIVRTLSRPLDPHVTMPEAEDAERRRRLAVVDAGGGPRLQISTSDGGVQNADQEQVNDFIRDQIAAMTFWPEIPAVRRLVGSPEGTLWIQRSEAQGADGLIDVFSPAGTYEGTLPEGSAFPAALGPRGLAAHTSTDDLGVTRIRVVVWGDLAPS